MTEELEERHDGRRRQELREDDRRGALQVDAGLEAIIDVAERTGLAEVRTFMRLHDRYLETLERGLPPRAVRTLEDVEAWGALRRRADGFEGRIIAAWRVCQRAAERSLGEDDWSLVADAAVAGCEFFLKAQRGAPFATTSSGEQESIAREELRRLIAEHRDQRGAYPTDEQVAALYPLAMAIARAVTREREEQERRAHYERRGPKPKPDLHADRMLAALVRAGRPLTMSEAQKAARMNFPTAKAALKALKDAGKVRTYGTGRKQRWSAT